MQKNYFACNYLDDARYKYVDGDLIMTYEGTWGVLCRENRIHFRGSKMECQMEAERLNDECRNEPEDPGQ